MFLLATPPLRIFSVLVKHVTFIRAMTCRIVPWSWLRSVFSLRWLALWIIHSFTSPVFTYYYSTIFQLWNLPKNSYLLIGTLNTSPQVHQETVLGWEVTHGSKENERQSYRSVADKLTITLVKSSCVNPSLQGGFQFIVYKKHIKLDI